MKITYTKGIFISVVFSLSISLTTPSIVFAHGGRLDKQGGHNCRVGSCASTYHCHQALGPVCGNSGSKSKSKVKK